MSGYSVLVDVVNSLWKTCKYTIQEIVRLYSGCVTLAEPSRVSANAENFLKTCLSFTFMKLNWFIATATPMMKVSLVETGMFADLSFHFNPCHLQVTLVHDLHNSHYWRLNPKDMWLRHGIPLILLTAQLNQHLLQLAQSSCNWCTVRHRGVPVSVLMYCMTSWQKQICPMGRLES